MKQRYCMCECTGPWVSDCGVGRVVLPHLSALLDLVDHICLPAGGVLEEVLCILSGVACGGIGEGHMTE